jgi:hypothetical protein
VAYFDTEETSSRRNPSQESACHQEVNIEKQFMTHDTLQNIPNLETLKNTITELVGQCKRPFGKQWELVAERMKELVYIHLPRLLRYFLDHGS